MKTEDIQQALEFARTDHALGKPVDVPALFSLLENALSEVHKLGDDYEQLYYKRENLEADLDDAEAKMDDLREICRAAAEALGLM